MTDHESKKTHVIAIVGPTCTGKTALSIRLARQLDGEVIGCDSRNIYKYMDIGTAKPTTDEQCGIPHHMFDVTEPDQTYTVAQYKDAATQIAREILGRGRVPIICGGTGLYARALLEGLDIPSVPPQHELRQSLTELADREGNEALHQKLTDVDPVTAARLNANDRFRIIRALEVSLTAGKPFSELTARHDPEFDVTWIGLLFDDRELLKRKIAERMQAQLDAGLMPEIESLLARYGRTRALMKAVNYHEFSDYLEGKHTFDAAVEESVRHNYQLARRQLMWFRTNSAINWFAVDKIPAEQIYREALRLVSSKH
ncbi:MAG: tRNA (adenosine(37)-N6)-dimethylallyltransferase MiaA [Terriglobales bacterium]